MIPQDPNERSALAGEYVLGLLLPAEAAAVEAALPLDPALDADVQFWETRLFPMCGIVSPADPGALLWSRIERTLGLDASRSTAAQRMAARAWRSVALWRTAAALAATAVLAVVWIFAPPATPPPATAYVAVLQAQDKTPGWLVEIGADRAVRATALAASDPGPGRGLQLWTLIDRSQGPVSLGMVPARGARQFRARSAPGIGEGQLFEITLEPESGSPIGRPSGPILFVGRAAAVGADAQSRQ